MEKAGNGGQNIQDEFLFSLRKERQSITVYLMNGYKLSGKIKGFDRFTVVLDNNGQEIMIFKHAISTIGAGAPTMRKENRESSRE
ncbi:MAG TPA: RNA chaperone Hfq [Acidobacteriota bacterium]|nr:RNA chaperone Hfq [Acidobacteriota bacterium]